MSAVLPVRWLTEAQVAAVVDLGAAVEVVEAALAGGGSTMVKTDRTWEGGSLHALGGILPDGTAGTKVWTHTPDGATPLCVLWNRDGTCRAVVEAFALGQLRTAAMTAIATKHLAPPSAVELAVIGSGKQAFAQVAAVLAVRPIEHVRVHSPTPAHRDALVERLRGARREASPAESVSACTADADVVVTVTRAREPFLRRGDVRPGAHVNAVGAIARDRQELHPDLVGTCDPIVADDVATARRLARELEGVEHIESLADQLGAPARDPDRTSLFKAMGLGLADVALAATALARTSDDGHRVPHPIRSTPSLGVPS